MYIGNLSPFARVHPVGNIVYSSPWCIGVEGEPVSLTLLGVFFIARGFATWLSRKLEVPTGSLRVSVGMDSRISGFAVRCVSLWNVSSSVDLGGVCGTPN